MPAAELTCACGHVLDAHERPTGTHQPWGGCRANDQIRDGDQIRLTRCDCSEAWPMEEND